MSQFRSIRDAVWACRAVGGNTKLVALRLVEHWPRIMPSVASLAEFTGLGGRTVERALLELEAAKVISIERHPGRRSTYSFIGVAIPELGTPVNLTAPPPSNLHPTPVNLTDEAVTKQTSEAVVPRKRGSKRVPSEWAPSVAHMKLTEDWGWSSNQWEWQLRKFRNHEFGKARSDWNATFENWLLSAEEGYARYRKPQPEKSEWQRKQDEGEYAR